MTVVLKDFENYLIHDKQASQNTYLSYMRDLKQLERYLVEVRSVALERASREDINAYLAQLKADGKSVSTSMRAVAAFKCFYNRLVLTGLIPASPVHVERTSRKETNIPEILSDAEIKLLLEQPKPVDPKGFRDRAMLELLCSTGMRVTELVSLNLTDINTDLAFVRCADGEHARNIPLRASAVDAVRTYILRARRVMIAVPDEPALFVNVNGERMTRQGFWKLIKHYAAQADIRRVITPHTLRHSYAVHLLENGTDLRSLQEIMGHADASSTMLYANIVKSRLAGSGSK
ncbi:MAG: tyrosine-type recombinase/integrase [Clostridiales bacterium]|jgi:integrase/recombinase XerD|nr:tyrosine-type recombinase/integrase [Clostridiales bacterium]